jgi:glucose/arabinose dehydrogenase
MKKLSSFFSALMLLGFSTTNVASGWVQPVGATFTPDGLKMFVWEKGGMVYVLNRQANGTYTKQTTPVLDISPEVGNWRDFGLLGFTLDPNFATNGNIYCMYVVDRHYLMNFGTASYDPMASDYNKATIGRITRYTTSLSGGNLIANTASRKILLGESKSTGFPILHESHGIGSLVFAGDGTLLASCGDGASYINEDVGSKAETYYAQALIDGIIRPEENVGAFRSQMLNSLNGKLIRIDPATGNGISSNPFYDGANPRSAKSRVWAMGLRNPFRFIIKPGTGSSNPSTADIGEIYIGDVGMNTFEELSIVNIKGANLGWPIFEGQTDASTYQGRTTLNKDEVNPLYNGGSCNQQFFQFKQLLKQATADGITTIYNPCNPSMAIGTNNRYFHLRPSLDWKHGVNESRVGIFNGNIATEAIIGTVPSGVTGSPFAGNCAIAGCWYTGTLFPPQYRNKFFMADLGAKWLKTFSVDFTDKIQSVGNFASGFPAIVCIVQNPLDGTIIIVNEADTNSQDTNDGWVQIVTYGGNQPPIVKMSADKIYGPSPLNVNFTGNQSSDPNGSISGYLWNFDDATSSTQANPTHNFTTTGGTPKKFVVKLTVTDNGGATSIDSIIISVNNTPPNVSITTPIKNSLYKVRALPDSTLKLAATVTDAQHSASQLTYAWQTSLRHSNHEHRESIQTQVSPDSHIDLIGCNGDSYYWHVELKVTDAAGLSTIDSANIFPNCAQQGPLPIVLRKFSVSEDNGTNLVKWATEQEENLDHFEVERSTNGKDFTTIHLEVAKNQPLPSNYFFPDKGFSSGVNYYRLKIIEIDKKVKYSVVVKTISDIEAKGLTVIPNPNKGNFGLIINSITSEPILINIRDVNGKLVLNRNESVNPGQNVIYINGLDKKPSGTYIITVEQGSKLRQAQFVKTN